MKDVELPLGMVANIVEGNANYLAECVKHASDDYAKVIKPGQKTWENAFFVSFHKQTGRCHRESEGKDLFSASFGVVFPVVGKCAVTEYGTITKLSYSEETERQLAMFGVHGKESYADRNIAIGADVPAPEYASGAIRVLIESAKEYNRRYGPKN